MQISKGASERISVCRPMLPDASRIATYLIQLDASRRYSNHGDLVVALQNRLRAATGARAHVVVAASGTSALTGAILACAGRAKARKTLCLVPAYTFIGTVAAIEQCGYIPYFIDVDPLTWRVEPRPCLDHRLLDAVGLVVPVATYGRAVPQAKWEAFSNMTGIPVVIDGAASIESLVAAPTTYLGNVPVAVSFHATKSFCTGEGGAVFCGDPGLWRSTLQCLNFGYDFDRVCRTPSINGKMSEYHAAVGLAELDGWESKCSRYARVVDRYRTCFSASAANLHLPPSVASNYVILEASSIAHAHDLMDSLAQNGVGHRRWYGSGAHRQPYCAEFDRDDVPVADDIADRLIGLPMSVDLTVADVQEVWKAFKACDPAHRPPLQTASSAPPPMAPARRPGRL